MNRNRAMVINLRLCLYVLRNYFAVTKRDSNSIDTTFNNLLFVFGIFFYRKKKMEAVRGILMQMHEHLGFSLRLNHAGNGR